ncbi:hypothetical protein K438DRAFT_1819146 [Mycena galopus ATCC 62051]|nr:hypothetical protein K438DRAFT_1819146 [Mycena galopus ATCC 62051]
MSRKVTKHLLTDMDKFTRCRFHERKRTTIEAKQMDGYTESKFAVEGVALPSLKKSERPGFLDCGCDEDAAFMEFIWFKTWTVKSKKPGWPMVEDMKSDVFGARHRAFFTQAFCAATGLTTEDYFSVDPAWGTPEYDTRLRLIQTKRMVEGLNSRLQLSAEEGFKLQMPSVEETMDQDET